MDPVSIDKMSQLNEWNNNNKNFQLLVIVTRWRTCNIKLSFISIPVLLMVWTWTDIKTCRQQFQVKRAPYINIQSSKKVSISLSIIAINLSFNIAIRLIHQFEPIFKNHINVDKVSSVHPCFRTPDQYLLFQSSDGAITVSQQKYIYQVVNNGM